MIRRLLPLGVIVIGACTTLGSSRGHELLAGDTGDRICGDSVIFVHTIGMDEFAEEGMLLSADSLLWVRTTEGTQLRLAAAIDRGLVIREAVTRHVYSNDSLLKTRISETGRFEARRDSAQYAFGDKAARVLRGPIARDAAVMLALSAAFDEILIRRARMTGRDSVDIPTYFIGEDGFTPTAHVRFIRPDSVQIRFGDGVIVAEALVDSVGRILSGAYEARGDTAVTIRRARCSK